MNTIADQYYIKALDQYPYSLEEAIENLGYALSHNNEHPGANYLMGKLHQEQMNNYIKAEEYYLRAMAGNPEDINVCMAYIMVLIILKEYNKAQKLIEYANKLKGVDLSRTLSLQALIHEYQRDYDGALSLLKQSRLEVYNDDCMTHLNNEIKRVKTKKKFVEKQQSKKESQEAQ